MSGASAEGLRGTLSAVVDWYSDRDIAMFVSMMAVVYLAFIIFGALLGYSLNAQMNALRRVTLLTAVYSMVVLALNLHWGYTGLFNIGVAGFMAVGVYTLAMLTAPPTASPPGLGLSFWIAAPIGVGVATLVGLIAALPALRLRADYLAIVTIAFSEIIRLTYLSSTFRKFTVAGVTLGSGGGGGISVAANPRDVLLNLPVVEQVTTIIANVLQLFGIVPNVTRGWIYALILLGFVLVFYWLLTRVGNSPFGRVLKAIREDEDVAQALGKNTNRFKIKAFMLGCGLMGLVGILWKGRTGFINPNTFLPQVTFFIWIALIIGGAGSNTGSVLGSALFVAVLFEGPRYVANVIGATFELGAEPATIAGVVPPLLSGDITPLFAFLLANIAPLRLVAMGVVLILLMQNRPEGLLGHRKEVAASVDLSRPESAERTADATAENGGDRA